MGLMDQIKKDIEQITSNLNEFGVVLFMQAPTGETATINGYYTDHSNAFDSDGVPITGKMVSIAVSEQFLIDASYPTRNTRDLSDFQNHFATINCTDGITRKYRVQSWHPDYSINLITLFLSEYAS